MVRAEPSPKLRGLVGSYCSYTETTRSFNQRQELASTACVFLLNSGAPIEIQAPAGETITVPEGGAFVSGVCCGTSWVRSSGRQSGIEMTVPAEVLERLLDRPMAELANRVVRLDDLWAPDLRESILRLGEAKSDAERFLACDDLVATRIATVEPLDAAASLIRRELLRAEPPTVRSIAQQLGWSEKRVGRRLRRHIGMSPSGLRRLARFERFWSRLRSEPSEHLADLALEAGYFDQPHLNREVRAFADVTPSALRDQVLPAGGGFSAEQ